jgi:hypothetical protein
MSDFGAPGQPPPPPPSPWGSTQPPAAPSPFGAPRAPGAPPPPPSSWGGGQPGVGSPPPPPYRHGTPISAVAGAQQAPVTRPRPAVTAAAVLLVGGGLLVAIGSFVTWFSVLGQSITGFTSASDDDVRDGPVFLTLGLLLVVAGVVLLVKRRVLGVAIAGIVVAVATIVAGFADLGDVLDLKDALGGAITVGPGLYMCIIGGLVALGGSIAATAKRRR